MKPIPGYEGLYSVTEDGRVWSEPRLSTNGRKCGGLFLSPGRLQNNHLMVSLRGRSGRSKTHQIHILVLTAYVGPRPKGLYGLHWDDNPDNNHVSNLRWGTPQENTLDSVRNGRHAASQITHCPRGHELVPENLDPHTRDRAHKPGRTCLACRKARRSVNGVVAIDPELADKIYEEVRNK